MSKYRTFIMNVILTLTALLVCVLLVFVCESLTQNKFKTDINKNDLKASEYRMLAEKYKSENALINKEMSEAKLKAYIKIYSGDYNENQN